MNLISISINIHAIESALISSVLILSAALISCCVQNFKLHKDPWAKAVIEEF